MSLIFRLLLTASALSLFVSLYLINIEYTLWEKGSKIWNYLFYISIPFIISYLGKLLSRKLGDANLGEVKFVETSNNDFLSNYLAFFFVALSLDDWITFGFCFALTTLFTFFSRVSYFNPILLIFGYNFYYIHQANGSKIMLITSEKIKSPSDIRPEKPYKRINDYTFIGVGK